MQSKVVDIWTETSDRRKKYLFIIHLGSGGAVAEVGGEGAGLSGTGTIWPEASRILLYEDIYESLRS